MKKLNTLAVEKIHSDISTVSYNLTNLNNALSKVKTSIANDEDKSVILIELNKIKIDVERQQTDLSSCLKWIGALKED